MFKRRILVEKPNMPLEEGDYATLIKSSYASNALELQLGTIYRIAKVRVSEFTKEKMVLVDGINHERWVPGKTFN